MSDELLEQYKLCVQMADGVLQRKQYANIFFFAVNSTTIPLLIAFGVYARHAGVALNLLSYAVLGAAAVGIINCLTWCYLLQYYHRLSSAKYEVVQKMEVKLGYKPYCDEQEILVRSKDKTYYRPLAVVESLAPLVFSPFYIGGFVLALIWMVSSF